VSGPDPAAQLEALRHGDGARLVPAGVLSAEGPDAADYLQGQLSQDLGPLPVGGLVLSLLLEPTGKVTALLRVGRTGPERFMLAAEGLGVEPVAERLRRFRLRAKVTLEPLDWVLVARRGGTAETPGAPAAGAFSWGGLSGSDALCPARPDWEVTWSDDPAYQAARIEAGVPGNGSELDERTIPAEVPGLVERAVSFTKGCYTGQELVARLDARGARVARRLCRLVPEGPPAGVGDLLWAAGRDRPVGAVTSWAPDLVAPPLGGLGFVHRQVAPGDRITAGPEPGAGAVLVVHDLGAA
jgi:folate-binding protein YgfZ